MFQRVCMRTTAYIGVILTVLTALGCRGAKVPESQAVVPELKLQDVRFRVYRGEALRVYGDADAASLNRDSSEVRAEELDATIPHGAEPLRFSAPRGEGSLLSHVFAVSGGVVATRGDDVARTASARYEPAKPTGLVRGDEPVVLEGEGYRLDGAGFTLDPDAGTIVVRGGAKLLAGLPGAP
jgi:lipopolysaccharide export system protein LptC